MTHFAVFFATTGELFYTGRGKTLPVSHQEGTILPLNSSGETIIYFPLENSWVGPIRFENPLPTICPDLQIRPLLRLFKFNSGSSWCISYFPVFAVKAGFLAGTVKFTNSFLINVFISARYVHFRFFLACLASFLTRAS